MMHGQPVIKNWKCLTVSKKIIIREPEIYFGLDWTNRSCMTRTVRCQILTFDFSKKLPDKRQSTLTWNSRRAFGRQTLKKHKDGVHLPYIQQTN